VKIKNSKSRSKTIMLEVQASLVKDPKVSLRPEEL
jgi:hypothetical protein